MRGLLNSTLAFFGASLGWWLGAALGSVFALLLSSVGCAAGVYSGNKLIGKC